MQKELATWPRLSLLFPSLVPLPMNISIGKVIQENIFIPNKDIISVAGLHRSSNVDELSRYNCGYLHSLYKSELQSDPPSGLVSEWNPLMFEDNRKWIKKSNQSDRNHMYCSFAKHFITKWCLI